MTGPHYDPNFQYPNQSNIPAQGGNFDDFSAVGHHEGGHSAQLRNADIVKGRTVEPTTGWRKAVYRGSFGVINLGKSKAERHMDELRATIRRHIRRQYVIVFFSGCGAGVTTMTASIGEAFKACRPDNVIAMDADPGFGTLAGRIHENPPGDYAALLKDSNDIQGLDDLQEFLGTHAEIGLNVLAGDRGADRLRPFNPAMYENALSLVRRDHKVIVVDTGDDIEHPTMSSVFRSANQLVFVAGHTPDTSIPVMRALSFLNAMGFQRQVSRSMVILNDSKKLATKTSTSLLTERFTKFGVQAVETMPYDPFLAKGGNIDIKHEMQKETQLRLYEIAAKLAEYYMPDAERPGQPGAGS